MTPKTAIVVPCYNEELRLDRAAFERFLDDEGRYLRMIFVDDGSRDKTLEVLNGIRSGREDRVTVLANPSNRGKAESVRLGVCHAFAEGFEFAGFWDADLATPLEVIPEFSAILETRTDLHMVFGSRVKLLGRHVERKASRHYIGRVFATCVSIILRIPIYDSQCGAKIFRSNELTRAAFGEPFFSRWVFDVEILARYQRGCSSVEEAARRIYEFPLMRWADIGGSKLKGKDFVAAAGDLVRIFLTFRPDRLKQ